MHGGIVSSKLHYSASKYHGKSRKFTAMNISLILITLLSDGTYLGVASHDNILDIYHVKKGKKRAACRGNSSYLTHFDWDTKG